MYVYVCTCKYTYLSTSFFCRHEERLELFVLYHRLVELNAQAAGGGGGGVALLRVVESMQRVVAN